MSSAIVLDELSIDALWKKSERVGRKNERGGREREVEGRGRGEEGGGDAGKMSL